MSKTMHYKCRQMKRTRAKDGPFTIRLNAETRDRLRALARRAGLSQADLVREAIRTRMPAWEQKGVLFNG